MDNFGKAYFNYLRVESCSKENFSTVSSPKGLWNYNNVVPVASSTARRHAHHRQRHFYDEDQLAVLDAEFEMDPFPNRENRRRIAQALRVPDKSVMVRKAKLEQFCITNTSNYSCSTFQWWFQNRRRRVRQQKPGSKPIISSKTNQRRQSQHPGSVITQSALTPVLSSGGHNSWDQQDFADVQSGPAQMMSQPFYSGNQQVHQPYTLPPQQQMEPSAVYPGNQQSPVYTAGQPVQQSPVYPMNQSAQQSPAFYPQQESVPLVDLVTPDMEEQSQDIFTNWNSWPTMQQEVYQQQPAGYQQQSCTQYYDSPQPELQSSPEYQESASFNPQSSDYCNDQSSSYHYYSHNTPFDYGNYYSHQEPYCYNSQSQTYC